VVERAAEAGGHLAGQLGIGRLGSSIETWRGRRGALAARGRLRNGLLVGINYQQGHAGVLRDFAAAGRERSLVRIVQEGLQNMSYPPF
jgi:hypothetical protein